MDDKEIIRGRIRDLWARTDRGDYISHTGFLPLDLQSFAAQELIREKIPAGAEGRAGSFFFGGFEEADRRVLFFLPSYMGPDDLIREIRSAAYRNLLNPEIERSKKMSLGVKTALWLV